LQSLHIIPANLGPVLDARKVKLLSEAGVANLEGLNLVKIYPFCKRSSLIIREGAIAKIILIDCFYYIEISPVISIVAALDCYVLNLTHPAPSVVVRDIKPHDFFD
jgi:hypothetical protein